MSHIPNSAIPHARAADYDHKTRGERLSRTLTAWRDWGSRHALGWRDRARDNPRVATTAAVTAAVGLVAALAFPLIRRRVAA